MVEMHERMASEERLVSRVSPVDIKKAENTTCKALSLEAPPPQQSESYALTASAFGHHM